VKEPLESLASRFARRITRDGKSQVKLNTTGCLVSPLPTSFVSENNDASVQDPEEKCDVARKPPGYARRVYAPRGTPMHFPCTPIIMDTCAKHVCRTLGYLFVYSPLSRGRLLRKSSYIVSSHVVSAHASSRRRRLLKDFFLPWNSKIFEK